MLAQVLPMVVWNPQSFTQEAPFKKREAAHDVHQVGEAPQKRQLESH